MALISSFLGCSAFGVVVITLMISVDTMRREFERRWDIHFFIAHLPCALMA
jgi:Cys-tRNA synthase (O-phospho-L-seryl-tRNA:Cys-tRNA synthase)